MNKEDAKNKIIFKKGETETIITNTMISISAPQIEIRVDPNLESDKLNRQF